MSTEQMWRCIASKAECEVVYPIYVLWITVFLTFSKDGTDIFIVCDAQIPRNDMIQKKKDKGINNELQNTTEKTKDQATRTPLRMSTAGRQY
jgi:hypothetical protein